MCTPGQGGSAAPTEMLPAFETKKNCHRTRVHIERYIFAGKPPTPASNPSPTDHNNRPHPLLQAGSVASFTALLERAYQPRSKRPPSDPTGLIPSMKARLSLFLGESQRAPPLPRIPLPPHRRPQRRRLRRLPARGRPSPGGARAGRRNLTAGPLDQQPHC